MNSVVFDQLLQSDVKFSKILTVMENTTIFVDDDQHQLLLTSADSSPLLLNIRPFDYYNIFAGKLHLISDSLIQVVSDSVVSIDLTTFTDIHLDQAFVAQHFIVNVTCNILQFISFQGVLLQQIPITQHRTAQISVNEFENEIILLLDQRTVTTLNKMGQFDHTIPQMFDLKEAQKESWFQNDGFVITCKHTHQFPLQMLDYIQAGRYICFYRAKSKDIKEEENQFETVEDQLWRPASYMRGPGEQEHYEALYKTQDAQYQQNKLRNVNTNCIWLTEPWVLKNPHEIIPVVSEVSKIQCWQDKTVIAQSSNGVQVYQSSSYIWSLCFEASYSTKVDIKKTQTGFSVFYTQNDSFVEINYSILLKPTRGAFVRTQDRISCLSFLDEKKTPHPYYDFGLISKTPVLASLFINNDLYQISQEKIVVSTIENAPQQEYSANEPLGFDAFEEQEIINQQNELEEKQKQKNLTRDLEDGYDILGEVDDIFRNDYYQEYDPEYQISKQMEINLQILSEQVNVIGVFENQHSCYLLGQRGKHFMVGQIADDDVTRFIWKPIMQKSIVNYFSNMKQLSIITESDILMFNVEQKCKSFTGINHNIYDYGHHQLYVENNQYKLDGFVLQYNKDGLNAATNAVITNITNYLITKQYLYIVINTQLIIFDISSKVQLFTCQLEPMMQLVSANNLEVTLLSRSGFLETRRCSLLCEAQIMSIYTQLLLDKDNAENIQVVSQMQQLMYSSRTSITHIPFQYFKNKQEFDYAYYFKLISQFEQKNFDLQLTAQNIFSQQENDFKLEDYLNFNLVFELLFWLRFAEYTLDSCGLTNNLWQDKSIFEVVQQFQEIFDPRISQATACVQLNKILLVELYNYQQLIYNQVTPLQLPSKLVQCTYLLTTHFCAHFYCPKNQFAIESELLVHFAVLFRIFHTEQFVKQVNVYVDPAELFVLLNPQNAQQDGLIMNMSEQEIHTRLQIQPSTDLQKICTILELDLSYKQLFKVTQKQYNDEILLDAITLFTNLEPVQDPHLQVQWLTADYKRQLIIELFKALTYKKCIEPLLIKLLSEQIVLEPTWETVLYSFALNLKQVHSKIEHKFTKCFQQISENDIFGQFLEISKIDSVCQLNTAIQVLTNVSNKNTIHSNLHLLKQKFNLEFGTLKLNQLSSEQTNLINQMRIFVEKKTKAAGEFPEPMNDNHYRAKHKQLVEVETQINEIKEMMKIFEEIEEYCRVCEVLGMM
ncbi:Conserved_hypothetical protein [Hexamita inflata]|uniref:Uncharacterized protein n=1 Tax=Hexamita inflata TaxID=28002 RepID=A0AA86R592_9EUKA|nr:Conserved hypothetical protein [Hexamita inflata]